MAEYIELTSFEDSRLDVYARLTENQLVCREYPEKGMFIAESPNVVLRAIAGGYEPVSLLVERAHIDGAAKEVLEKCGDIPVFTSEEEVLLNLTGYAMTRGLLCAMKRKKLKSPEEILANSSRVVILDSVMNPTNVGAIFRSAAALGMDAVLLTPGCSDPLYRRAARVSMGTVFQIPWTDIGEEIGDWPDKGMGILKKAGFRTAAFALSGNSVPIDDEKLLGEEKIAVIMGNEGYGLDKRVIEMCDYNVKIPMSHGVDSLNVAAASAIAFWQLGKH